LWLLVCDRIFFTHIWLCTQLCHMDQVNNSSNNSIIDCKAPFLKKLFNVFTPVYTCWTDHHETPSESLHNTHYIHSKGIKVFATTMMYKSYHLVLLWVPVWMSNNYIITISSRWPMVHTWFDIAMMQYWSTVCVKHMLQHD